jgi:hypothetical protein
MPRRQPLTPMDALVSRRSKHKAALFWARFGAFMVIVLGVFVVRGSTIAGVALLIAGAWAMWSPSSKATPLLATALLALGALMFGGYYAIEDGAATGIWAMIAGLFLLRNSWTLPIHAAALSRPTLDEAKAQQAEDIVEEMRSSPTVLRGDEIEFAQKSWLFGGGTSWRGRLRSGDVVFESIDHTDQGSDRAAFVVPRTEFEIRMTDRRAAGPSSAAEFRLGDRKFKGTISQESFERYSRWRKDG